ncbi:MAG: GNAT family N-acetyltransferase [Myxococcota bacterium]|nr:GNAT family N-acetyltransferase [Myxococcota bacterium]
MKIERLAVADLPHLAELFEHFWGEASSLETMRSTFTRLAENSAYILLAAKQDGRLIGFVMGIICEELYGDGRPFMIIEDLIVAKDVRRRGAGRALMLEMEKRAIQRQCRQIIFVTEADRTDSIRFYASLGYDAGAHRGFKKRLRTIRPAG